jgi:CheY-like chemotaxis protein
VKLLVVEDEERVASFLNKGLRAHGYDVEWMPNGQDALARLQHPGISLVILDLGLPDLDGLDVLEGLRARGSTVPVLVLSARGRVGDRVKGLNLGADDYLGKPFAFEELLARVRANLRPRATGPPGVLHAGRISIDPLRREVTADGRGGEPVGPRILPAESVRRPPRPGPVPARTPVHGMGHQLRPADKPRRRLHRLPAPQTGRAHHHNRPWGRVLPAILGPGSTTEGAGQQRQKRLQD